MSLPETFSTIKSKMNSNVAFAIEHMNTALVAICTDEDTRPKDKLKVTQEYLGLYLRLENEIAKEKEQREVMKQRKLVTRIKQAEVNEIEDNDVAGGFKPVLQTRFSPTMTKN